MAHILFYEKPGCINNTKQKTWLSAAGHDVESVNLLEHPWTKETLTPFLGDQPVADWFNRTAPVIKSGEIDPGTFSKDAALAKMVDDPLLIKRPLILVDQTIFLQGFDKEKLDALIGLTPKPGSEEVVSDLAQTDLTTCPKASTDTSCDDDGDTKQGLPFLAPVVQLVEEMGLEVTYAFEDLVFVEHSAFLFQFLKEKTLALYFNEECLSDDAIRLEQEIIESGGKKELTITRKGTFTIGQKEGEETLEIVFFDED